MMNISTYILAVIVVLASVSVRHRVNCFQVDLSACLGQNWAACGLAVGTGIYRHYTS